MSIRISSFGSEYQRDDDAEMEEQRRRNALQRRKQSDQRSMDALLDARRQGASARLHEGGEASRSLLAALLSQEEDREGASAAERSAEAEAPPSRPRSSDAGASSKQPPRAAPSPKRPLASQAPALGARGKPEDASASSASVQDRQAHAAQEHELPAYRPAQFAEDLDSILTEVQSCQVHGGSPANRLDDMLRALGKTLTARGVAAEEVDAEGARRIDGACNFLAAYIEGLDCSAPQRAGLLRNLETQQSMIRGEAPAPQAAAPVESGMDPDAGADSQALRDRQTLYAHLELLKSLAKAPCDSGEARQLAARIAERESTDPSAALLRLAASGDSSVSLYVREISRQLQRFAARRKEAGETAIRGPLGEWLNHEWRRMAAAIQQVEGAGAHGVRKRSHDAARELELRAGTMPLAILKNA